MKNSIENKLNARLEKISRDNYMDYFGIADITSPQVQDFIRAQGGDVVCGYPFAITVGIAVSNTLADMLPEADDTIRAIYKNHIYTVLANRLEAITSILAGSLQAEGCKAFTPPAGTVDIDRKRLAGIFSAKLAPHLAGLGWIGKSCMLITPQHGPRVIWGTVLADAPLQPTGTPMSPRCGTCRACADICPAKAYTGRNFDAAEPREARFNPHACLAYITRMGEQGCPTPVCGLCLAACPHGRQHQRNLSPN